MLVMDRICFLSLCDFLDNGSCSRTLVLYHLQATVLCDIIALNVLKRGPFYRENKYVMVTDEDAFQVCRCIFFHKVLRQVLMISRLLGYQLGRGSCTSPRFCPFLSLLV